MTRKGFAEHDRIDRIERAVLPVEPKPNQFSVWVRCRWWKNSGINPNQPNSEAEHDPNQPATKVFPFTLEKTWLVGTTPAF